MQITTIFKNGGSQAIRIPSELRLEGSEVFIKRVPEGLLLIPKEQYLAEMWAAWAAKMQAFADENGEHISVDERGGEPQVREGLDEIFP